MAALLSALPGSLQNCTIAHVLSSRSTAFGLTRASSHLPPIPTSHFSLVTFKKTTNLSREDYDIALAERIRATKPDLVVLAGWMLILSEGFLNALKRDWDESDLTHGGGVGSLDTPGSSPYEMEGKDPRRGKAIPIINLHPALPGTFPGAHAIKDAWDAFNAAEVIAGQGRITKTGIMIHRVIPLLDAGEPVVVREIEMKEGETLEELEERIHGVEHVAIVDAVGVVVGLLQDGSWWNP